MPFTPHAAGVSVSIKLTPNARQAMIGGMIDIADGKKAVKASVRAVPEEGKANTALVALIAERLQVPKRSIAIISGDTHRQKILMIEGDTDELMRKLSALI